MSQAYADTSFLVSLYAPDANSPLAAAQMGRTSTTFLVTSFGEVELANARQLRVFRREFTSAEAQAAYRAFQHDLAHGVLTLKPVPAAVYAKGKQLARRHTSRRLWC